MRNYYLSNSFLKKLFLGIILILFLPLAAYSQEWFKSVNPGYNSDFSTIKNKFDSLWQDKEIPKGLGYKPFKRAEYFLESRLMPDGSYPDYNKIYFEWQDFLAKKANDDEIQADAQWNFVGPINKPEPKGSSSKPGLGRVNCITFDPQNDNVIYIGAATGGIWKTTNGGSSWQALPMTDFLSIGISDIAVAPSNSNIIYAATGDADVGGVFGIYFNFSIGIIKSTNGGQSWFKASPQFNPALSSSYLFNKIFVHPTNPNLIYVSSNLGFFRSTDGGVTLENLKQGYCRDFSMKMNDPDVYICAFVEQSNQQYKYTLRHFNASTNSWKDVASWLDVGRVQIEMSKANPNIGYILNCGMDQGFHSLYKTTDGGNTWNQIGNASNRPNYLGLDPSGNQKGGQGVYDLALGLSPINANELYIGGINIWQSTDGGNSFKLSADWIGMFASYVHADIHTLVYNKSGLIFAGSDGGVSKSTNGGKDWTDISNGLGISQFYRIGVSAKIPGDVIGGTQDNGTSWLKSGNWSGLLGGDGMECLIDPNDPNYVYGSVYYGNFSKSTNGGSTFTSLIYGQQIGESGAWVTPIAFDPKDPTTLYVGYKNIYKLTGRGATQTKISNFNPVGPSAKQIAVAPSNSNYIYAAYNYDGESFKLIYTTDGGSNWGVIASNANTPITWAAIDPKNPKRLWYVLGGYSDGQKVFEFDGSKSKNISGTLPNVPVNCIVYQNNSPDRLYIGTDLGVFMRENNSDWKLFGAGLPTVIITDLEIQYSSGKLYAGTYGRGIWETKVNDCNLNAPELAVTGKLSFCEGDSVVIDVKGNFQSYKWSNGLNSSRITIKETGTYSVTVTDTKGCSAKSDDIFVEAYQIPNLKITKKSGSNGCQGDTTILQASFGFAEYNWSNGQNGRQIQVTEPGKFTLYAITANGCRADAEEFELILNEKPTKPIISLENNELVASDAPAYQWYLDGSAIDGAIDQRLKFEKNGSYLVKVTNQFECSNSSDAFVVDFLSVQSAVSGLMELNIMPNPAGDFISIDLRNADSDANIRVVDAMGNELWSKNLNTASGTYTDRLDLSKFASGYYIIEAKSGIERISLKFIKE